ncbi:MAG: ferredoxin [Candidatus Eisenbacteria bacterium]
MEVRSAPYAKLVLVCVNLRPADDPRGSCAARGGQEVYQELKMRVKERRLPFRVRVSHTGCLDLCAHGPIVQVWPAGRVYTGVQVSDVETILDAIAADDDPILPPEPPLA